MRPPHHQAMGENPNPSFTHHVRLFYHELSYVRALLMIQVQLLVDDLHRGHLGSYDVIQGHQQVLTNNSRLKTSYRHRWSHCACIVTTHRLICIMSYLDQHFASGELDLRSDIDVTLLRSPCIWFEAS